ncbi:MAG: LysR family transcriptional regulator [Deltaproteobacteria bacterium]|jgi:DNA-binding transcriptional LysR family regulator
MQREDLADLAAFVSVAREGSFTRAASRLGMSQSGLSQVIRRLEERYAVRLLDRTTRSVAPTQAGEHLLASAGPMLDRLDVELTGLSQFRDRVAGVIRITAVEHAARTVIGPAIAPLLLEHPDIQIEVVCDYTLADVVSDRFDAGVRIGEQVELDMVAVRISPDIPMAIVGSPDYLERSPAPKKARDLLDHRCINLRLPTRDTVNAWRVVERGRTKHIKVEGPLVLNTIDMILDAALAGVGLAYLPLDQVHPHIEGGRLVSILPKRLPPLPGYHLYFANRHTASPAFRLFVDAVRYRRPRGR